MVKTFGFESTTDEVLEGVNLSGQRVLITGVSAGLGVETARAVVAHGGIVVGTARDLQKARRALAAALPPGASVELVEADLASLSSVRKAADELLAQGQTLRCDHRQCGRDGVSAGQDCRRLRDAIRNQSPWPFRVRQQARALAEVGRTHRHAILGWSSNQRRRPRRSEFRADRVPAISRIRPFQCRGRDQRDRHDRMSDLSFARLPHRSPSVNAAAAIW